MIARVFPCRTSATPTDEYAFVGDIPLFLPHDITEVHISVTFTWDLPEAERLANAWGRIAPTKIGGPATGQRGEGFTPGMYLKPGYVVTSRGCNNKCWFCSVPKREGVLRELPLTEGWNVLDDNILACSAAHVHAVFKMLSKQKGHKVILSGGLEAKLLRPWHLGLFQQAKVQEAFFAYDEPNDLPPLEEASKILRESAWYKPYKTRCFVLCGYPGDTIAKAEERCMAALKLGFFPFAMFYRSPDGKSTKSSDWAKFQRSWTRPAAVNAMARALNKSFLEKDV